MVWFWSATALPLPPFSLAELLLPSTNIRALSFHNTTRHDTTQHTRRRPKKHGCLIHSYCLLPCLIPSHFLRDSTSSTYTVQYVASSFSIYKQLQVTCEGFAPDKLSLAMMLWQWSVVGVWWGAKQGFPLSTVRTVARATRLCSIKLTIFIYGNHLNSFK